MIDNYEGMFGDNMEPPEEFIAYAGAARDPTLTNPPEENIIKALQTVYDPEIPVNIYELGLIYKFDLANDGSVEIEMSLTSPGCPVAGELPGWVAEAVAEVPGIGEVTVKLVWDPMWNPEMMSEDAKLALGMF